MINIMDSISYIFKLIERKIEKLINFHVPPRISEEIQLALPESDEFDWMLSIITFSPYTRWFIYRDVLPGNVSHQDEIRTIQVKYTYRISKTVRWNTIADRGTIKHYRIVMTARIRGNSHSMQIFVYFKSSGGEGD